MIRSRGQLPRGGTSSAEALFGPESVCKRSTRIKNAPVLAMLGAVLILLAGCLGGKSYPPEQLILQMTGCFGSCPAFTIVLNRNGRVIYDGAAFTEMRGRYEGTVSKEDLDYAFSVAEEFPTNGLQATYDSGLTDQQTIRITIKSKDRTKMVEFEDDLGPYVLRKIEHAIEGAAASIKNWRKL